MDDEALVNLSRRVHDVRTRSVFDEACRCYRAGAYRSAIVAAWISVVYDLILKARALQACGALRTAVGFGAEEYEDKPGLLRIEKDILEYAYKEMKLFDKFGFIALDRLRQDRCSCAHPEFADSERLYTPDGDAAAYALKVAVKYVLANVAGVNGKENLVRAADVIGARERELPEAFPVICSVKTKGEGERAVVAPFSQRLHQLTQRASRCEGCGEAEALFLNTVPAYYSGLQSAQADKLFNSVMHHKHWRESAAVYESLASLVHQGVQPDPVVCRKMKSLTPASRAAGVAKERLCAALW